MPVSASTSRLRFGARAFDAVDAGVEVNVLAYGQVFIQAELLAHVADMALDFGGVFADVHAEDGSGAGGWEPAGRRAP